MQTRSAAVSWDPVETVIAASTDDTTKDDGDNDAATADDDDDDVATEDLDISYQVVIGLKTAKGACSQEKSCYQGKECHFR